MTKMIQTVATDVVEVARQSLFMKVWLGSMAIMVVGAWLTSS